MEVFHARSIITSLSTSYVGDADVLIKGADAVLEEGITLHQDNYLLSAASVRINNYNALYLTGKQLYNDVIDLKKISPPANLIFVTTIRFAQHHQLLRISNTYSNIEIVSNGDMQTTFEIEIVDDTSARISYQNNRINSTREQFEKYYLSFNGSYFYFTEQTSNTFATSNTYFKYILDGDDFYWFATQNKRLQSIAVVGNELLAVDVLDFNWKSNLFKVNNYVQTLAYDFNTAWAAYDVVDRNSMIVDTARSAANLKSNSIFYSNYTYITGNSFDVNFITLKNQHTHKNFSYRANNLDITNKPEPNVDMRDYHSLCTGVEQEQGSESISLTYEFYNADYRVKADKYTVFRTPESLYPYDQINVNDTMFSRQGAIGGDTPYTADKIFFNDTRPGKSDGQYLCTWLSAASPDGESIWVDRYYMPERTSYLAALTAKSFYKYLDATNVLITTPLPPSAYYDAPFVYLNLQDEINHTPQTIKDALYGEYFFDKVSDLIFVPNQDYIYQRIGPTYIDHVLQALSSNTIQTGLNLKTVRNVSIDHTEPEDDIEHVMNNDSYTVIDSYRKINDTNAFTASFWLNADDWSQGFGHEVLGNFNDSGFGVLNDQVVTPIIMIQDGRRVVYLNTNFDEIDVAHLSQNELDTAIQSASVYDLNYITTTSTVTSFFIKDIIRGDHLDTNMPVILRDINTTTQKAYNSSINTEDCGLILSEEDDTAAGNLTTDRVFDTNLQALTGMEVEPCKFSVDKIILPNS